MVNLNRHRVVSLTEYYKLLSISFKSTTLQFSSISDGIVIFSLSRMKIELDTCSVPGSFLATNISRPLKYIIIPNQSVTLLINPVGILHLLLPKQ